MSAIPVLLLYSSCHVFGIVLYSIYYRCDPVLNKHTSGISRYDQMVPAYLVNKFGPIPGMTGLLIAGVFSSALSTISSGLNSASTVTVVDFIKPLYKQGGMSDLRMVQLAKIISIFYGVLAIGGSFCLMDADSLVQLINVLITLLEGPMCAVFLIGVLTRKASDKCISFAVAMSYLVMSWIAIGSLVSKYNEATLPLSTDMCPSKNATNENNVTLSILNEDHFTSLHAPKQLQGSDTFVLYKISFLWFGFFGFLLTLIFTFIAVLITGWKNNVISANSICLSPVTHYWMKSRPFETNTSKINKEEDNQEKLLQQFDLTETINSNNRNS